MSVLSKTIPDSNKQDFARPHKPKHHSHRCSLEQTTVVVDGGGQIKLFAHGRNGLGHLNKPHVERGSLVHICHEQNRTPTTTTTNNNNQQQPTTNNQQQPTTTTNAADGRTNPCRVLFSSYSKQYSKQAKMTRWSFMQRATSGCRTYTMCVKSSTACNRTKPDCGDG